jgi:hypothetical protein
MPLHFKPEWVLTISSAAAVNKLVRVFGARVYKVEKKSTTIFLLD